MSARKILGVGVVAKVETGRGSALTGHLLAQHQEFEEADRGIVVRAKGTDGKRYSVLVPWSNISYVTIDEGEPEPVAVPEEKPAFAPAAVLDALSDEGRAEVEATGKVPVVTAKKAIAGTVRGPEATR